MTDNITNPLVEEYINKYYKPLNEQLHHLREYAEENHIPIILRETESFLLQLLRWNSPKRILEIGTSMGYSASCFATVCEGSRILTVENNEEIFERAVETIGDLDLSERIHVFLGDGVDVMERLIYKTNVEGLDQFDFIFIDAAKSHYRRFFDVALKLVKDKGMIVCDNALMNGRTVSDTYDRLNKHKTNMTNMREFIDYITTMKGVITTLIPVGDGLTLSIVNKE